MGYRPREVQHRPVCVISTGPSHHFFGYYDKCPWDASGRYVLALETPFMDRNPTGADPVTIGMIDLAQANRFIPLAQSRAWNWQQGCMLRWLPGRPARIMYNDLDRGKSISRVSHVETRQVEELPWPLYDVSCTGQLGATLNFARLCQTRPGYGYWGIADPHASEPHPDDDGVYVADPRNRSLRLIVSHRDVRRVGKILPAADEKDWSNHLKFNPSATRLVFLHRWDGMVAGHVGRMHRVMTVNPDGSDLRCLLEGYVASHFDWYDDERILIWLSHAGGTGFFLVDETTGAVQAVGPDFLTLDGHCNFRPQRDWFLTDTYPQGEGRLQFLMLVHPGSNRVVEVAARPSMPVADASLRCDLHARWNHDGTSICLDSTHERSRQMYILDVSDVVTS